MKLILTLSMFLSMCYSMSTHPVLLMTIILMHALIICVVTWVKLKVSWFAYILFLIFLGGLMVLFIYITSLASNEMMKMTTSPEIMIMFFALLMLLINYNTNNQEIMLMNIELKTMFYFMYSLNFMVLTVATMLYLLLTLVVVVKVSNKFEAPIKNLVY